MTDRHYTPEELSLLADTYRQGLLQDTLPFWIDHAVDRKCGGFTFCVNRRGEVFDTDKGLWQHGRFAWLLASLHRHLEPREEWLELSHHGVDFLRKFGFDDDGRAFFQVTRDGQPLRKRRYLFTELFASMAFGAYGAAADDSIAVQDALDLFELVTQLHSEPGHLMPKVRPDTRPTRGLAMPMIILIAARELRSATGDPRLNEWVDRSITEIEDYFVRPELEAVLEVVGEEGEFLDHIDGRTLNPGHAIECGAFILEEAHDRGGDERLVKLGTTIVDWSWRWGWDEQYGGMLYFRDVLGKPCTEYWHDMKFWWPHNEAVIATLLAYRATNDPRYAEWHRLVHDWSHRHFADPEFGEWYGYLHRDGRISTDLKGNLWKGPFHLPRMQWMALRCVEGLLEG